MRTILALALVVALTLPVVAAPKSSKKKPLTGVAVLHPTQGSSVKGAVWFIQHKGYVLVKARVTGLAPGKHGFHIHQYGNCSGPKGTTAGGHFNPKKHQHGAPTAKKRHHGDLGNLVADNSGVATLEWKDKLITLTGKHAIIGRGVIVHENVDDLKTQPTGNAGGRVACGVIGLAH